MKAALEAASVHLCPQRGSRSSPAIFLYHIRRVILNCVWFCFAYFKSLSKCLCISLHSAAGHSLSAGRICQLHHVAGNSFTWSIVISSREDTIVIYPFSGRQLHSLSHRPCCHQRFYTCFTSQILVASVLFCLFLYRKWILFSLVTCCDLIVCIIIIRSHYIFYVFSSSKLYSLFWLFKLDSLNYWILIIWLHSPVSVSLQYVL